MLAPSSNSYRMTSQKQAVEIRFAQSFSSIPHILMIPSKILSKHVAWSGHLYAGIPLTKGGEGAYVNFLCYTLLNLHKIVQGGETSTTPANALRMQFDKAKSELLADDIDRVINTIKVLLTDEAWGTMKKGLMDFIRYDYCKDFFTQVCAPTKASFGTLLGGDLFTGYQYLLGRSPDIIHTMKVHMSGLDTRTMASDMCFLRFYANEKTVATMEDFLDGLITCSAFGILQGLYQG